MAAIQKMVESARNAVDRAVSANSSDDCAAGIFHMGYVSAMLDQIEAEYKIECTAHRLELNASDILKCLGGNLPT